MIIPSGAVAILVAWIFFKKERRGEKIILTRFRLRFRIVTLIMIEQEELLRGEL